MIARVGLMAVVFVLGLCGLAIAQEAETASPEQLVGALGGLLATGAWGGLWKGAFAGMGRGLVGYLSKHNGTRFEGRYLVPAALSGAVAGLIMGILEVPFDQAHGWMATVGTAELLNKLVKMLWHRWAGDHVGEAVARTVARRLPSPSGGPPEP